MANDLRDVAPVEHVPQAPVEHLPQDIGKQLQKGIGLCLSGGGYRAMLFHLGALWRLNELGYLPKLARVSSVSGGSITAGVLAMNWKELRFDAKSGVSPSFTELVVTPVRRLASVIFEVQEASNEGSPESPGRKAGAPFGGIPAEAGFCDPAGGVAEGPSPQTAGGASRSSPIRQARNLRCSGGAPARRAPHGRGGPLFEIVGAPVARAPVPDVC